MRGIEGRRVLCAPGRKLRHWGGWPSLSGEPIQEAWGEKAGEFPSPVGIPPTVSHSPVFLCTLTSLLRFLSGAICGGKGGGGFGS